MTCLLSHIARGVHLLYPGVNKICVMLWLWPLVLYNVPQQFINNPSPNICVAETVNQKRSLYILPV